ncbi:unnamed protein product, partial [Bubo scandiacus]
WAWFLSKRDQAMKEDGRMTTCGLNAARNQKPTEHVCLAAQTLLWCLAKTVLHISYSKSVPLFQCYETVSSTALQYYLAGRAQIFSSSQR